MSRPADIDKTKAQLLMSKLSDGELSAHEADILQRYLESNPDEIDWLENLELARNREPAKLPAPERLEQLAAIQSAINETEAAADEKGAVKTTIPFPRFIPSLAAAAAIALVSAIAWMGFQPSSSSHSEAAVVEFVATDLPDASTYIYTDEEIGWTVVWIDSDDASNKG